MLKRLQIVLLFLIFDGNV